MPIKERVLKRLTEIEQDLDRAWKNGERDAWATMLQQMEEARSLCQKGLPESRYAVYGEIYDGMILAGKNLIENSQENAQEDVVFLFFELVRHTMEQTRKEQHFKKEIVFLPYKASMWDSLESVWKAAHEDKEHCNAYVIPIPYADLNPDRSVAEWHCERGLFPEDVPTLDWQQVDLQEWHPDVIFIHNPYDNFNRVTSIESRYYSEKLKAYTDKLVYIPYFVLEEPHPDNGVREAEEEKFSHFVLTPGVINADQVIVQSEGMRELYINVLTKNTNQSDRTYWEKRISGVGSPKFDKVLTSKKEDFEMPETWRKLAEGRTVILYNTSLSAMLQYSDKVCDKLRYVFDVFRNRKDVVLWWRPHPLMKSTLHSMRPQFEEEYLRLEKEYIEEEWGIYDDSSNLHRAICWSDGYYGDASSVMPLYQRTNKPIMMQNLQREIKLNYKMYFEFFELEGEKLWGISQKNFIGLYEIDLHNKGLKCLGELPIRNRQPLGRDLEYVVIKKLGNKIVIAPYFSRDGLIVYDIGQSKFDYIPIDKTLLPPYGLTISFIYGYSWRNSIFFIGNHTGIILEFCTQTGKVVYHSKWSQKLCRLIGKENVIFERQGYVKKKNFLYMVVSRTNFIVKLNMDTMESEICQTPHDFQAINLCYDGEFFWLVPRCGKHIIRWNEMNDMFQKVMLPMEAELDAFIGASVIGDRILLFPLMANYVLRIEPHSYKITKDVTLENCIKDIHEDKYNFLQCDTERLIACLKGRTIQKFDVRTGNMENDLFKVNFDEEREIRLLAQYGACKNIISYEAEDMDVCLWMEIFLKSEQSARVEQYVALAGSKTYRMLFDKEKEEYVQR